MLGLLNSSPDADKYIAAPPTYPAWADLIPELHPIRQDPCMVSDLFVDSNLEKEESKDNEDDLDLLLQPPPSLHYEMEANVEQKDASTVAELSFH